MRASTRSRPALRRLAVAVVTCLATITGVTVLTSSPAGAYPSRPPTEPSYYISSSNTSEAFSLGCDQGSFDKVNNMSTSEVVLDFGVQKADLSGTILTGNGHALTTAQVEAVAENFALGYWSCTGTNTAAILYLDLGTNNDNSTYTAAMGSNWALVVVQVNNWITGHAGQVRAQGANDIEPGFHASYSKTLAWANAYSGSNSGLYLNFGSADGCPQTTATNGSCNNGWNQFDIWNLSWAIPAAVTAPEIYFSANAKQWEQIALYGNNVQHNASHYLGVWDENDLDHGTTTSQQAWDDLLSNLYSNSATAHAPTYSMEIQQA